MADSKDKPQNKFLKVWKYETLNTKYTVYCCNASRETSDGNKYRRMIVNNNKFDLLWEQLSSRDLVWWENSSINPSYTTFEGMKKDLLHVLTRG